MREEWRPIPDFAGYEASSEGRIRSVKPGRSVRLMNGSIAPGSVRYLRVSLRVDGRHYYRTIHTLVAAAFLGPRPEGLDTRHINGDELDNRPANLCYGTRSENEFDKVRHGSHPQASKTHCKHGHPFSAENTYVILRKTGRYTRDCRICTFDRLRRSKARRSAAAAA